MNDKKTSLLAFAIGAPIGCLGGLIGLGGLNLDYLSY